MTGTLPLAVTTFGFLYRCSREEAFRQISEAGYSLVELAAGPPHLDLTTLGADDRRQVADELRRYGLQCVSVNPLELNPTSTNSGLAQATHEQYKAAIDLAGDVGANDVVMISGRLSPLVPMPLVDAKSRLLEHLELLMPVAEKRRVTVSVEAVPYGFLQTVEQISAFLLEHDLDTIGITLDAANVYFIGADPAGEFRANPDRIRVVHISDSWRTRWAHTQVGQAEINFADVGHALRELKFGGSSVYELADEQDPAPRLRADWRQLNSWGWAAN